MNVSKAKSLTINGQPVAKLQVGNVVIWEKGGEPEKWELDEDGCIIGEDGKYYQRYFRIDGEGAYHPDIDLNEQWVVDTVSGALNIDENFDYYMSNSNYHVGGGYAQFKVTWSGLESITFLYRSDGESNYDFLVINGLDKPKFTSAPSQSTSGILAHTYGKQTKTYFTLTIDTPDKGEHFVWFCYRKDGSVDSNSDRAFIGVPNNLIRGTVIEKQGAELRYDYVESTDFVIAREGYVQYKSYKTYYSPNDLNSFTTDEFILGEEFPATPVNHNYLRFDAVTNSAHIGFNQLSLVSGLQYTRAFEETFAPFPSEGVDIQQGNTIWLRANGMSSGYQSRGFSISSNVECHGDMRYLLNPSDPEQIPSKNDYAFMGLLSLTHITTLPDIYIISGANPYKDLFMGCQWLSNYPSVISGLSSIDGGMFALNTKLKNIEFPDVSYIGVYGLSRCVSLTSISLPFVEIIDASVFKECTMLSSIYLPQASKIGYGAFSSCNYLRYVDLPKATSIGLWAFSMCGQISYYNLPAMMSLTGTMLGTNQELQTLILSDYVFMENNTFSVAAKLSNFSIPAYLVAKGETVLPVSYRSQLSSANFMLPSYHSTFSTATEIEDGVYGIDSNVMGNNNSLARVSLPYCWYLGSGCFKGCVSLSEVYAPNVRYMGESVFYGCVALQSINFPELSGIIESSMFYNCSALTEVNLPKIKTLYTSTFYNHYRLVSVHLDNAQHIGSSAFMYCRKLSDVFMPNVLTIGSSAFLFCDKLTSIDLPNVQKLEDNVFANCSVLTYINIPNVSYIGGQCFSLAHGLSRVSIYADKVKTIGYDALGYEQNMCLYMSQVETPPSINNLYTNTAAANTAEFYVPSSLVDTFKTHSQWSSLASRIFPYEG